MGQLDEAAADIKKALELNPMFGLAIVMLSQIYVLQGRPQVAFPEIKLVRYDHQRAYLYAIAYYALGRKKESDDALRELIHKFPQNTIRDRRGLCFPEPVRRSVRVVGPSLCQRNSGLIETKVDPLLENLHHDPRYAALLKKLNLPN